MRRDLRRALACTALVLAGSGTARAYVLMGIEWTWQDHPFEDPVRVDVDSWPAAYSDAQVEDSIEGALDEWTAVGLDLSIDYGGTEAGLPAAMDGHWDVIYDTVSGSGWGGVLAYASPWTYTDGVAIDCDITYLSDNDYGDITWSVDGSAGGSEISVGGVALHEFGHCLGLDHSASDDAIMYANYTGLTALQDDDIDGVSALYGSAACADDDGDGFSDCEDDCNDGNAAIYPGAPESCDGVDQGCDGVVDQDTTRTVAMGSASAGGVSDFVSVGNAFDVEEDTLLLRVRQRFLVDADVRLIWSLSVSDDGGSTWTIVRTERTLAGGTGEEASPDMMVPLEGGRTYAMSLGAPVENLSYYSDYLASKATQGPITPLGYVYSRAQADLLKAIEPSYLMDQELDVVDLADEDGDDWTALCGDCDTDESAVHPGAAEACDGLDNDCNGSTDDGFPDSDGDTVNDCLDACPDDAADDRDGDGSCDSDDPCPDDETNACDDDTGTADGSDDGSGSDDGTTDGTGDDGSSDGTTGDDGSSDGSTGDDGTGDDATGADGTDSSGDDGTDEGGSGGSLSGNDPGGCACATSHGPPAGWLLTFAALLAYRRRR